MPAPSRGELLGRLWGLLAPLRPEFNRLLFCVVLSSPAILLYAAHYWRAPASGLVPTGIIQYDQPYYIALAREVAEDGNVVYANPFSHDYDNAHCYFQPQTALIALVIKIGCAPNLAFLLFGLLATLFFARSFLYVWDAFDPGSSMRVSQLCVFWGGGIISLVGIAYGWYAADRLPFNIFRFDSLGDGWFFLNLGRNLTYPTESWYHGLFLLTLGLLLKRAFLGALCVGLVLSFSHPFNGLDCATTLCAWSGLEVILLRRKACPAWFAGGCLVLLLLHLGYYMVFLPHNPEHRMVLAQWTDTIWGLMLRHYTMLPAYAPAFVLAAWTMRTPKLLRARLADPRVRLMIVLAAVVLLLSNNEMFLRHPVQPIHFESGYVYTALAFIGLPALNSLVRVLASRAGWAGLLLFGLVCCFDNITWFGHNAFRSKMILYGALSRNEHTALRHLDAISGTLPPRTLLVSPDMRFCYMAGAFTPLRAWVSDDATTPDAYRKIKAQEDFFLGQSPPPDWRARNILFALPAKDGKDLPWAAPLAAYGTQTIWQSDGWIFSLKLSNAPHRYSSMPGHDDLLPR